MEKGWWTMIAGSRTILAGLYGAVLLGAAGAALAMGDAAAADPRRGPLIDNRARIEQDIRRNYNNYNRNVPTSPVAPRIREQHLRDGVVLGPASTATANCSYQYGRWKRSGSKYWRDRYYACAD